MHQEHSFAEGRLLASASEGVGRLVLAKPEKKNAVDAAMWSALPAALAWLEETAEARCVLIEGAGGNFSAGADIGEFDVVRKDAETARAYEKLNAEAFRAVRLAGVPTVAVIRGVCYGGGFGIAAACDFRMAESSARFAVPAARLGLAYPVDAVGDFIETLGAQTAKRLLYTAAAIDAGEALDAGFLLSVHDDEALDREAVALAAAIAANAPLTIRASKLALRAAVSGQWEDREKAAKACDATFESSDYAEGRAAFAAKRRPRFTGR